ncbi:replication initiation protein, RepL2 [Kitasatospora sp. NPDC101447]|uniref:replication initiation protein, RepL2 n=1 Tax=Kitasatospora sp. NPDC101447 TaxID=3364102 RepID=UPI00380A80EA
MSDTHNDVRALIGRTKDLTANQRLLLVHYAALPAGKTGTQQTGQALAAEMGWAPTFFSRIRKELVEADWLEEYDRFNNIRYYRPTDQALGRRSKVVRLRPPAETADRLAVLPEIVVSNSDALREMPF